MNNQDIFHVVNEVSYVLSLSNEPQQLVEIVLDKLFQVLAVDSRWIQLVDPDSRRLRLVACRGFTAGMKQASGLRESEQGLSSRVVTGLKALITDLSRDGVYTGWPRSVTPGCAPSWPCRYVPTARTD